MAAKRGELHHKAKLTDDLVREARRLRTEEGLSYFKICERFDWPVCVQVMAYAVTKQTWRHVQ